MPPTRSTFVALGARRRSDATLVVGPANPRIPSRLLTMTLWRRLPATAPNTPKAPATRAKRSARNCLPASLGSASAMTMLPRRYAAFLGTSKRFSPRRSSSTFKPSVGKLAGQSFSTAPFALAPFPAIRRPSANTSGWTPRAPRSRALLPSHLHRTTTMTRTESPLPTKPKTSSPQLHPLRRRRRRSRPKDRPLHSAPHPRSPRLPRKAEEGQASRVELAVS